MMMSLIAHPAEIKRRRRERRIAGRGDAAPGSTSRVRRDGRRNEITPDGCRRRRDGIPMLLMRVNVGEITIAVVMGGRQAGAEMMTMKIRWRRRMRMRAETDGVVGVLQSRVDYGLAPLHRQSVQLHRRSRHRRQKMLLRPTTIAVKDRNQTGNQTGYSAPNSLLEC